MNKWAILVDKYLDSEWKNQFSYNDNWRFELSEILERGYREFTTDFSKSNWSEQQAYTLGYNQAVKELKEFFNLEAL